MALCLTPRVNEPVYIGESNEVCIIVTNISERKNSITKSVEVIAQIGVVIGDQPFILFDCRAGDVFHVGDNMHIKLKLIMQNSVKFRYHVPKVIPIRREALLFAQSANSLEEG